MTSSDRMGKQYVKQKWRCLNDGYLFLSIGIFARCGSSVSKGSRDEKELELWIQTCTKDHSKLNSSCRVKRWLDGLLISSLPYFPMVTETGCFTHTGPTRSSTQRRSIYARLSLEFKHSNL